MKVNAKKIIEERKLKAWSQQHLATASDVSLRTIERVENEGVASLETVKALAACFELNVTLLMVEEVIVSKVNRKPKIIILSSTLIALICSALLLVPTSMASNAEYHVDAAIVIQSEANDETSYYQNVEILLPKSIKHTIITNVQWQTESPLVSGNTKLLLPESIVFLKKATIATTHKGTTITASFAKFTPKV